MKHTHRQTHIVEAKGNIEMPTCTAQPNREFKTILLSSLRFLSTLYVSYYFSLIFGSNKKSKCCCMKTLKFCYCVIWPHSEAKALVLDDHTPKAGGKRYRENWDAIRIQMDVIVYIFRKSHLESIRSVALTAYYCCYNVEGHIIDRNRSCRLPFSKLAKWA